ncbi:hypothetical protein [Mycolicibacterium sp. 120270]|uniref:hypothetical protein n=1 Tax=Mycolicibacterium sp. 120270 TaxID=3090600 RepID=UPI00299E1D37|nr:hypothetical protein [Mycolicibacterium sp. 120270]MDX1885537.1 hypothetical protein [Mycolicibacterium sp. 120270]
MTEAREPRTEQAASSHADARDTSRSLLVWVGIVAGVVFIVAVVFFSGFVMGRASDGNYRGGHHQSGMMGSNQWGPYGYGLGMMGPRGYGPGMMGPGGPQQTPAPTTPRPQRAARRSVDCFKVLLV